MIWAGHIARVGEKIIRYFGWKLWREWITRKT